MTRALPGGSLLVQGPKSKAQGPKSEIRNPKVEGRSASLRRLILDSRARTPLKAKIVIDEFAALTTVIVGQDAPSSRVEKLARQVSVVRAPLRDGRIDLRWLLHRLGAENVTSLLVEGGGEVNASFLLSGLAHRVAFFYAPKVLGGANARKAVAGTGARNSRESLDLVDVRWRR